MCGASGSLPSLKEERRRLASDLSLERHRATLALGNAVVVIKQYDDGSKERAYPFVLAAGIERYPLKVTKSMGAKKLAKRSKVKPFIKVINYNHLMPTRYALELEGLKGAVSTETFKEVSQREDAKKVIKKLLEERYASGKNRWFFQPLRF
ncbi:60S ribosomal protein L27B [Tilletia horrida]|nr:60S ribosomal protein L27B [Tilletia horrida]KAK0567045.1 60S ribosomal protein L27B [Tilletia horrida]